MIDYFDAGHRIGTYWGLSALGFAWFAWLAVRRLIYEPTRLRASIVAFAMSWSLLCANNALFRFDIVEASSLSAWEAETIRAFSVASLLWLCWEFRSGRAQSPPVTN